MNNNTFKSLSDLSKGIKEKIDLIDNGKYGLKELESALQELNELQERLIVLKYKAIEQLAFESKADDLEASMPVDEPSNQENVAKETLAANSNQMTIMDGIKDISKESVVEKTIDAQISFGDTLLSEEESLAEKLENSSIEDLKSVISINQRFSFIKELFGNDGALFDRSIDRIQNSVSMKDADEIIEKLRVEHRWTAEDEMVLEFEELIKRRFSA